MVFFLHFFTVQHGTSCSGENRLESSPSGRNGDAKEPLESEGKMLSQEDEDNDDSLSDDDDEEEDAGDDKETESDGDGDGDGDDDDDE